MDTDLLWQDARMLGAALAAVAAALMLVTLAKYAFGRIVLSGVKLDDELFIRDNPAAAILVIGFGTALLAIAVGVVQAEGHATQLLHELAVIVCAVGGGAVLVLLGSAPLLLLEGAPIKKSVLEDRNIGVALAAAGAYIAEGFVVHGVIATSPGELPPGSPGFWDERTLIAAAGFFVVAQIPLIAAVALYRRLVGFDMKAQLARGNVAAGLSYGSCIAAMGVVIGHAARGEFRGWSVALTEFAIYAIFGLLLLPTLRFAVSAVLVPNSSLTHEVGRQDVPNWGAALLEAFAYLGAASLVVASS